ncbi:bifunctional DNA primase/polymerase [Actinoplanes sp. NPDC049548]|uniref:bifunctional DNA primase/polymerase n=1 Tax=Actinoplanes sp. NPDC049548 TaxID=3155152 RepID=UPI003426794A
MMLDAALAYARHGIPVLPVHTPGPDGSCSCGRPDCDRPGKHPRVRHGLTDATADLRRIEMWWSRWPDANIGLRTGVAMDVADVDSATGWHGLRHLLGGLLPRGPQVRTGSGGWHFWFSPLGYGNRVRLLPGVDWRGAGGYVVAPPSRHASGTTYYWVVRPGTDPPSAPDALRGLIAGPDPPGSGPFSLAGGDGPGIHHPERYAAAALAAETDRVARAAVGTRNDTLNRAAFALGRLVGEGLLDAATVTRELTAAGAWCGLGRTETIRTIRSGLTAGRRCAPPFARPRRAVATPGSSDRCRPRASL